jgi:hypothetical protein
MHLAWIEAATFINLNVWLVAQDVGAVVQFYAAVTSLLVLFATALFFLWRRQGNDTVVPMVLTWALLGIYVELGTPADSIVETFRGTEIDFIRYAAASGAIIIVVDVVVKVNRWNRNGGKWKGNGRNRSDNTEEMLFACSQ